MSGTGYSCDVPTLSCVRSPVDVLNAGASYPAITLTLVLAKAVEPPRTVVGNATGGGASSSPNGSGAVGILTFIGGAL